MRYSKFMSFLRAILITFLVAVGFCLALLIATAVLVRAAQASDAIRVVVIDTGIDGTHPDLLGHVSPTLDFSGTTPADVIGHGTHVAGLILRSAPNAQLISVKFYTEANSGSQNLGNTIRALTYTIGTVARIVNYSGGGPEASEQEYIAIKRLEAKGVLIVAAAGNNRENLDSPENEYFPGSYRTANIITVAGVSPKEELTQSSNWGAKTVDVAAPGENVLSSTPGGKHHYMTGTSQAAPQVTGLAVQMLEIKRDLTPTEIREIIVKTCRQVAALQGKVRCGGVIDPVATLNYVKGMKK